MSEESIRIPLAIPGEFWDETDRRFDQMARRAAQQFSQAMRGAGSGSIGGGAGGGGGGSAPGGGAFDPRGGQSAYDFGVKSLAGAAGPVGGAGIMAASAFATGFGQGIRNTPAAAASSPEVLAQNGLVNGVGNLLSNTVGQIPVVGDFVMAQFNSAKEAMEIPTERGVARLKGVYGNFAVSGVETSREERDQAISFSQEIERRRYSGERQIEREYREIAARDSISYGLSWIGR